MYVITACKSQVDKIPELACLKWKLDEREILKCRRDGMVARAKRLENQIKLTTIDLRHAEKLYLEMRNKYKIIAFKNWL